MNAVSCKPLRIHHHLGRRKEGGRGGDLEWNAAAKRRARKRMAELASDGAVTGGHKSGRRRLKRKLLVLGFYDDGEEEKARGMDEQMLFSPA